ncbi:MAG: amidohydrolase family protein [Pseudomonadota bacterium]
MKILYRAPLVVPVISPPIEDGAVLVENGVIVAVDRFYALKGEARVKDHEGAILTPALFNCHTHLELSHLALLGKEERKGTDITDWISSLLAERALSGADPLAAGRRQLAAFHEQGVIGLADIGNLPQSRDIRQGSDVRAFFFLEMLGLGQEAAENVMGRLADLDCDCTAHAPYSVNELLLRELKKRSIGRGHLFPIHVAESETEIRFLLDGAGPLRDFVEQRGVWDNSFHPPGCGSVAYLDRIGVLDEKTLCVHCVHVTDDEIALLALRKARVCLCPASNRYLGVGKSPVSRMLAAGLLPCLGTDSAASNPAMSIWEEMHILRADHPGIDPADIFRMATLGGAVALGESRMGMLAPGMVPSFLAVQSQGITADDVHEFLTGVGASVQVDWVEEG